MFYYLIILTLAILSYRYYKNTKNLDKIMILEKTELNNKIIVLEKQLLDQTELTDKIMVLEKQLLDQTELNNKIIVLRKQLLDQTELTDKIMVLETINKNMNNSIIELNNICNNKNELFKNNLKIINYYIEKVYILEHKK
jgi:hypothetical protein